MPILQSFFLLLKSSDGFRLLIRQIIMKYMDLITNAETSRVLCKKLAPPLGTVMFVLLTL